MNTADGPKHRAGAMRVVILTAAIVCLATLSFGLFVQRATAQPMTQCTLKVTPGTQSVAQSAPVPGFPPNIQTDPKVGADATRVAEAQALTTSIAERNTAWASYVFTVVGILFTVIVLFLTVRSEIQLSRVFADWSKLKTEIEADKILLETASVDAKKAVRAEIQTVSVPMADFMVTSTVQEILYSSPKEISSSRRATLGRMAHQGVRLLVQYEPEYSAKEAAVRRLSRVIIGSTLTCLNDIEKDVRTFAPSQERDDLVEVIEATRKVVREALAGKDA